MKSLFITGTGTDIGKTYITSCLLNQLKLKHPWVGLKPVISGFSDRELTDTHQLLNASSLSVNQESIESISPFRYKAPLSPDRAAHLESKNLDYDQLITFCKKKLADKDKRWLIEGVGGVMVPLNAQKTTLDWMQDLQLPVLLVAGSYLGALSHILTALHTLLARNIEIAAIIVNESSEPQVGLEATIESLQPFVKGIKIMPWPQHQQVMPMALRDLFVEDDDVV